MSIQWSSSGLLTSHWPVRYYMSRQNTQPAQQLYHNQSDAEEAKIASMLMFPPKNILWGKLQQLIIRQTPGQPNRGYRTNAFFQTEIQMDCWDSCICLDLIISGPDIKCNFPLFIMVFFFAQFFSNVLIIFGIVGFSTNSLFYRLNGWSAENDRKMTSRMCSAPFALCSWIIVR